MFSTSIDGILIIQDQKAVFVNPSFNDMLGYEKDELIGNDALALFNNDLTGVISGLF